MKVLAVLPWVIKEYRDACLAGCKLDVLEVDNSTHNLGIMRSHNLGIDEMRRADADALIILSAAVRFGEPGGLDFVAEMERNPRGALFNAIGLFGWHMMGFPRETIELAGRWDEHFSPYGLDDNDYAIRVHHARPHDPWPGVHVDANDRQVGMGHSIKSKLVKDDPKKNLAYFECKWGDGPGPPFEDYYAHPFNRPEFPIGYWPPSPIDGTTWDQEAPK